MLESTGFSENDTLYIIGDVIDRGSESIKLLKWIMRQSNIKFLLGNHEKMMLDCQYVFDKLVYETARFPRNREIEMFQLWIANGGNYTYEELEGERPETVEHIWKYLGEAPLYAEVSAGGKDFVLVHGGLGHFDPEKPLEEYTSSEILWERPSFGRKYYGDRITVFGHTPTVFYGPEHRGKAVFTDTWINIDAGVAARLDPMILRLDDLKEFYVRK